MGMNRQSGLGAKVCVFAHWERVMQYLILLHDFHDHGIWVDAHDASFDLNGSEELEVYLQFQERREKEYNKQPWQ